MLSPDPREPTRVPSREAAGIASQDVARILRERGEMLRRPRPLRSLDGLAAAIEASAMVDPYPRLTRLLESIAPAGPDPYPRLARVLEEQLPARAPALIGLI